jgi:hypothetical protein
MLARTLLAVLAVLVLSTGIRAQQNLLVGTWKLNLAKSKYSPGPAPKSRILKIEALGSNGFKLVNDGILANGQPTHTEETFIQDGKDHPFTGNPLADTHVNSQVDAYTTETVQKKNGKAVQILRRVVSRDGKTMTITVKGLTASGAPLDDVRVFDRQ